MSASSPRAGCSRAFRGANRWQRPDWRRNRKNSRVRWVSSSARTQPTTHVNSTGSSRRRSSSGPGIRWPPWPARCGDQHGVCGDTSGLSSCWSFSRWCRSAGVCGGISGPRRWPARRTSSNAPMTSMRRVRRRLRTGRTTRRASSPRRAISSAPRRGWWSRRSLRQPKRRNFSSSGSSCSPRYASSRASTPISPTRSATSNGGATPSWRPASTGRSPRSAGSSGSRSCRSRSTGSRCRNPTN